jgi:hypothetical protein
MSPGARIAWSIAVLAAASACAGEPDSPAKSPAPQGEHATQSEQPTGPFQFRSEPVSVSPLGDFDLAYFMTHARIVAESPPPHMVPDGQEYHYRILGAGEQGNFEHGGPRSIIFVTVCDYTHHRDGNIRMFRINGTQFWEFLGIEEYKADLEGGYFLSFKLASRPTRQFEDIYLAKVGFEAAAIEKLETREW